MQIRVKTTGRKVEYFMQLQREMKTFGWEVHEYETDWKYRSYNDERDAGYNLQT